MFLERTLNTIDKLPCLLFHTCVIKLKKIYNIIISYTKVGYAQQLRKKIEMPLHQSYYKLQQYRQTPYSIVLHLHNILF